MSAEADVYCGRGLAGRLSRTKHGAVFEYDRAFLKRKTSIAFNLPWEKARVETVGVNVQPYFAGLLPEGLRLSALVRRVKTSKDDLLSLLVSIGADCIGDVSVVEAGKRPHDATPSLHLERAGELSFAAVLEKSLGARSEAALPGVQEKVSATMISLPVHAEQACILKLNPPNVPRLVENESFFMSAARACRITTADARLIHDRDGESGLLVTRFDRQDGAKLHQEDACQLLDLYPADKYRLSVRDVMEALRVCSAPKIERLRFLRLVAFSYLIGNGDLHGKNVSVRIVDGRTELTPAYDLLSTLPYGDTHMAMKLEARDANLKRAAFIVAGERFDIPRKATNAMLDELVPALAPFYERLDAIGFDAKRTRALEKALRKRAAELGASTRSDG